MLVILGVLPVTSPRESVRLEEPMAEVSPLYLVGMLPAAVGILLAIVGRDQRTASPLADEGVIARIDVDGHAGAMSGHDSGTRYTTEVEGRGIVVAHGGLVVGIVGIDQHYPFDGIHGLVQLAEDVQQVVGNVLVADELALQLFPILIIMEHREVAEVLARCGATLCIRTPLHPHEDGIRQCLAREAFLCRNVTKSQHTSH